jgi:uncharacterized phiE125 gp8 family phage protein
MDGDATVRVYFTAGYGDNADDVPATIRHWLKICVAELYNNREQTVLGTTIAPVPHVATMLDNYRVRGA